jgi:hypothetical protein
MWNCEENLCHSRVNGNVALFHFSQLENKKLMKMLKNDE